MDSILLGMIERSMYIGHHDWGKVRHTPTDVRAYVKEILLNVSRVHAEVKNKVTVYHFSCIFISKKY